MMPAPQVAPFELALSHDDQVLGQADLTVQIDTAQTKFLRAFAPFWNLLIPKHAVGPTVGPDPSRPGNVRYLHATKGWRSISKARLSSLGFAL